MSASTLAVKVLNQQSNDQVDESPSTTNPFFHFDELASVLRLGRPIGRDFCIDSIFQSSDATCDVAASCLVDVLQASVVEGNSAAFLVAGFDRSVTSNFAFGKAGLLATTIDAIYKQIEAVRTASKSATRFSVRVSAVRLLPGSDSSEENTVASIDLLENSHFLSQSDCGGSNGDIPKLFTTATGGAGSSSSRLAGPRELRASTPQRAFAIAESALKLSPSNNSGVVIFTLNIYQYQIEKQVNGAETISGGRGQCHFIEFGACPSSSPSLFSIESKIINLLAGCGPQSISSSSVLPLCSLTSQLFRDLRRIRCVSQLALVSNRQAYAVETLNVLELLSSLKSLQASAPPPSAVVVTRSFDSNTLPRQRTGLTMTSSSSNWITTSSLDQPSLSGSELSVHTVIHRHNHHHDSYNSLPRQPPSLFQANNSEAEETGSVIGPSLAPMQPLIQVHVQPPPTAAAAPQEEEVEDQGHRHSRHHRSRPTSSSNNTTSSGSNSKYVRLKRFAASRMKKQMEFQRMMAWMDGKQPQQPNQPSMFCSASGGGSTTEVWIDGPHCPNQTTQQQQQYWIDGPLADNSNNNNSLRQQHRQSRNRSLPRMMVRQGSSSASAKTQLPVSGGGGGNPLSQSCSGENFEGKDTMRTLTMEPLVENVAKFPAGHPPPPPPPVGLSRVLPNVSAGQSSPFTRLRQKLVTSSSNSGSNKSSGSSNPEAAALARLSRLTTDSSDSGDDSGIALFGGPEASPPIMDPSSTPKVGHRASPAIGAPQVMAQLELTSGPVASSSTSSSGSSGRGSASSLASGHSANGSSRPSTFASTTSSQSVLPHVAARKLAPIAVVQSPATLRRSAGVVTESSSSINQRRFPLKLELTDPAAVVLPTSALPPTAPVNCSIVSDSPSVDELACLESLERQLMGTIASLSLQRPGCGTRC